MSNKRNPRRGRQRVRSEANRKPVKVTKGMEAFIAMQPAERERKANGRRQTKNERREQEIWYRRRYVLPTKRTRKERRVDNPKPRRVYGRTFYQHSLDT